MTAAEQVLIDKIKQLPPQRMAEVEDFVDFLRSREVEQRLTRAAAKASEASFAQVWDNDEDAAYDRMCCHMVSASSFSFGDVVLVPFPFTDQSGIKKRPAVVVLSASYNASRRDIVIMAITSQVRQPLGFGEALVSPTGRLPGSSGSPCSSLSSPPSSSTSSSARWGDSQPPMPRRCARSSAMSSGEARRGLKARLKTGSPRLA